MKGFYGDSPDSELATNFNVAMAALSLSARACLNGDFVTSAADASDAVEPLNNATNRITELMYS